LRESASNASICSRSAFGLVLLVEHDGVGEPRERQLAHRRRRVGREQLLHELVGGVELVRVDGHQVLEMAVLRTILDHPHLSVTLDDLSFDLADLFVNERRNVALAAEDLFACLDHAVRAKRIGRPGKSQRRFRLLP
jgi:hypothetical protein